MPLPFPRNIVTDVLPRLEVTTSSFPSLLKSPEMAFQEPKDPALVDSTSASEVIAVTTGRNIRLDFPPPGAGVTTVIQPVPAAAVRIAGTAAVSFRLETNVVVSCVELKKTWEVAVKFDPVTVNVNSAPPGATATGPIASIYGTGCVGRAAAGGGAAAMVSAIAVNRIPKLFQKVCNCAAWRILASFYSVADVPSREDEGESVDLLWKQFVDQCLL